MERTRTRKILTAIILVCSILLCLTGCIRYEVKTRINADGTADFRMVYAIADVAGDANTTDSTQKKFVNAGWDVEKYEETDGNTKYTGFTASIKGIALEDIEKEMKKVDMDGFKVEEESDGVYTLRWDASSNTDDAKNQGVSADYLTQYGGYMRFILELPGKVIETNGRDSTDGKTIEWNLMDVSSPCYAKFNLKGGTAFPTETKITVNKNKTADIELSFEKMEDDDQREALEDLGWDLGGKSRVTAAKDGVKLEDLQEELNDLEMGFEKLSFEFDESDKVYTLEWDAPQNKSDFVLELPNEAEDSNSESEGTTLEWSLDQMEEPISAEFKVKGGGGIPMFLLIAIIAGGVILIGIIILVIVLISKKKKGPKAPDPVPGIQNNQFTQPQQFAPQSMPAQPSMPQMPQTYAPQAPQNPTAGSGLPNPGFPQAGSVPPPQQYNPQNQDNNNPYL